MSLHRPALRPRRLALPWQVSPDLSRQAPRHASWRKGIHTGGAGDGVFQTNNLSRNGRRGPGAWWFQRASSRIESGHSLLPAWHNGRRRWGSWCIFQLSNWRRLGCLDRLLQRWSLYEISGLPPDQSCLLDFGFPSRSLRDDQGQQRPDQHSQQKHGQRCSSQGWSQGFKGCSCRFAGHDQGQLAGLGLTTTAVCRTFALRRASIT